jgi:hypothetical protein
MPNTKGEMGKTGSGCVRLCGRTHAARTRAKRGARACVRAAGPRTCPAARARAAGGAPPAAQRRAAQLPLPRVPCVRAHFRDAMGERACVRARARAQRMGGGMSECVRARARMRTQQAPPAAALRAAAAAQRAAAGAAGARRLSAARLWRRRRRRQPRRREPPRARAPPCAPARAAARAQPCSCEARARGEQTHARDLSTPVPTRTLVFVTRRPCVAATRARAMPRRAALASPRAHTTRTFQAASPRAAGGCGRRRAPAAAAPRRPPQRQAAPAATPWAAARAAPRRAV